MEITRDRIFKELVVVEKLGKKTAEENIEIAKRIGKIPYIEQWPEIKNRREKVLFEGPGVIKVTEGGLFGHKETLDWHANKASSPNRSPIVWIYAVKGSEGSITSWIDNRKAYEDLPNDIKKQCENIKITCGFKRGNYTDDPFFREHHNKENKFNLVYTNEAGIKGLYFPYLQVMGGLSDDLFEYLKSHILQDKYRYDHYWQDGDVVISEQWLTIHKRHAFDKMHERLMYRITID
tara:strand:- start:62 stop:766 length:705 start_codon:yes stop_codon:yes gene_type:complete